MKKRAGDFMKNLTFGNYWLIAIALLLGVFIRANSMTMPYERDEGEYAYSAWVVRNGGEFYGDAFMQKPPMIIYTYLAGQVLFDDAIWAPRFMAIISVIISGILLGLAVTKIKGKEAGILAMLLMPPLMSFPYFMGVTANTEIFMVSAMSGLFLMFVLSIENEQKWKWFFGAVLSMITLMYKPISVYFVIYIHLLWLFKIKSMGEKLKYIIVSLMGVFVSGVLISLPIIIWGNFGAFWESAFIYNMYYVRSIASGFNFVHNVGNIITKLWIIVLMSIFYFVGLSKKEILFSAGVLVSCFLGAYQSGVGHYYLILMIPLCVFSSVGIIELAKKIQVNVYALEFVVIIFVLWPMRQLFYYSNMETLHWIYGYANPFEDAVKIGEVIKSNTAIDDKIYIFGSEPQIYYYAGRKSVSRQVIAYPMTIDTEIREKYQKELMDDINENLPKMIVYVRGEVSGFLYPDRRFAINDYADELLINKYNLFGVFVWDSYDRKYWLSVDKIEKGDFERSSIAVYKLKNAEES